MMRPAAAGNADHGIPRHGHAQDGVDTLGAVENHTEAAVDGAADARTTAVVQGDVAHAAGSVTSVALGRHLGHLAWRGIKGQIPEDYPYTVRVVSDVLESNGSSSMATTCAGTLALMDAGVPIKNPVAGIAMGLIKNPGEDKYAILSDILGDEDHLGDMDFKTTGTKNGLTATQMDIKCDGLSYEILERALMQAKAGREHIMGASTAPLVPSCHSLCHASFSL